MFRIDRKTNRISPIAACAFSDLGFSERDHLQEWLANEPGALGEELLIIQKEFDGFDDTKERLDLLAIDKDGYLVVIENKLDDSGKDVVWQGLKYASYCSGLSKVNVVDIYQRYLEKLGEVVSAQSRICEFLEVEDFNDAKINIGNRQRLILVAARFRKEVTSTVLWLLRHGVDVKCFKATPYQHESLILLSLEQVIPLAEAEEFMIGLAEKEQEEETAEKADATRHSLRREFWRAILDSMEGAGFDLYSGVNPSPDHWLNAGSGLSGVHYALIFSQSEARVEFVLSSSSKDKNKAMFDFLFFARANIESAFGGPLDWRRMDDKKGSIIQLSKSFDGYNKENWPLMIEWLISHMRALEMAFSPQIESLRQIKKKT